jgi:hypothetical protein
VVAGVNPINGPHDLRDRRRQHDLAHSGQDKRRSRQLRYDRVTPDR